MTSSQAAAIEYRCRNCGLLNRVPRPRLHDDPVCGRCKRKLLAPEPVSATDATFREEVEGAMSKAALEARLARVV